MEWIRLTELIGLLLLGVVATEGVGPGPQVADEVAQSLMPVPCTDVGECSMENAFCDLELGQCQCKPDFPVTDGQACYKESRFDEYCRLDIQCKRLDANARCNPDLNVCQCGRGFKPQSFERESHFWCIADASQQNGFDPTLYGIMGGLILMFIVMCVVMQLFARAQFEENRTIFNTPNARLMNVSLMRESKLRGAAKKRASLAAHGRLPAAVAAAARPAFGVADLHAGGGHADAGPAERGASKLERSKTQSREESSSALPASSTTTTTATTHAPPRPPVKGGARKKSASQRNPEEGHELIEISHDEDQ